MKETHNTGVAIQIFFQVLFLWFSRAGTYEYRLRRVFNASHVAVILFTSSLTTYS